MRFQRLFRQKNLLMEKKARNLSLWLPRLGLSLFGIFVGSITDFNRNTVKAKTYDYNEENKPEGSNSNKQKLRVKNLVFKGGGPKGLAYIGALKALENSPWIDLNKVERVAGSSAGAIVAAALAVGYKPDELRKHMSQEVMLSFVTHGLTEKQKAVVKKALGAASNAGASYLPISPTIRGGLKAFGQLLLHPIEASKLAVHWYRSGQALSDGEYFRNWLNILLRDKVVQVELERLAKEVTEKEKNEIKSRLEAKYTNLTFGQLAKLIEQQKQYDENQSYFKHLFIVGAQDSGNSGKVIKRVSTSEKMPNNPAVEFFPDLIIADMVRESMSIPLIFTSSKRRYISNETIAKSLLEGQAVGMDGGVLENYPYRLFDLQCYLTHPDPEKHPGEIVKNHETLGFVLFDKTDIGNFESLIHKGKVAWNTRGDKNSTRAEDKPHYTKKLPSLLLDDPNELPRHVFVNNCGVTLTDFNLPPKKIEELIASGHKAVELFSVEDKLTLKNLQINVEESNKNKTRSMLRSYGVLTNIDNYSPSQHYVKTHHYKRLQEMASVTKKGIIGISFVGIGGSGKSQFAYYSARKHLENHFWKAWQAGKFHSQDRRMIVYKKGTEWVWDNSIALPIIWIFDAANPNALWESLCSLATKLDDEKFNRNKGYKKQFEETKSKEKPSVSSIKKLQQQLQDHPDFLWVFDNLTEESLNQNKEPDKLGYEVYIPSQNFVKGQIWLTTQMPSLRAADPNFKDDLTFNDGMNQAEARKLLFRFTEYNADSASIDRVINLLERIPFSLAISGAYMKYNNISYDEFHSIYQKYEKELEEEFDKLITVITPKSNDKALKRPMKITISLALKSLFSKPIDNQPSYADFLRFCSKLHVDKIDEILLYDYIKMLNPDWSENKIKKHLQQLIRGSLSLLENITDMSKRNYRMHQITQSIINGEWQPVDEEILSQEKHRLAIKNCLKILLKQFNEQGMLEDKKFMHNQSFLPHVDKVLSFYPDLAEVKDLELFNLSLPLYRTRCFMNLAMNRANEAGKDVTMLINSFKKRGNLTASNIQQSDRIYKYLAKIDKDWPANYAAMLYIEGRAFSKQQVQTGQPEKSFDECILLCKEIEIQTGRKLIYEYLSERAKLKLPHGLKTLQSLIKILDKYEVLLADNSTYYSIEGDLIRFDKDDFNLIVCQEHAGQICLEIGQNLSLTDIPEAANYFKKAEIYLLNNIQAIEDRISKSIFEVAARYYNSVGFLYLEHTNPNRNLVEAGKHFRKAYELEMAKNGGRGKWSDYLADACYGLALIAKELALYSNAEDCAEMCKEIKEFLGNNLSDIHNLLQAIKNETKNQPGGSSTLFFKQPKQEVTSVIREQLQCGKDLRH